MTNKPQKKFIVMVKRPDGTKETVIMKFRPRTGSELEDGSVVVKTQ
jgi:hypothetical protein